jgi:hypothetical protein
MLDEGGKGKLQLVPVSGQKLQDDGCTTESAPTCRFTTAPASVTFETTTLVSGAGDGLGEASGCCVSGAASGAGVGDGVHEQDPLQEASTSESIAMTSFMTH